MTLRKWIMRNMCNVKCIVLIFVHLVMVQIIHSNSRSPYLLRVNETTGEIEPMLPTADIFDEDPVLDILVSAVHLGNSWTRGSSDRPPFCKNCQHFNKSQFYTTSHQGHEKNATPPIQQPQQQNKSNIMKFSEYDEDLDCGKPVNNTVYDHLVGIANRMQHPNVVEPHVSLISKKKLDMAAWERKLKKMNREQPKSVKIYNHIGNFWRLKGDTYKSIECFRRALAVSPTNADVLLNLGRVMYTLQYLDDAISLTKKSLEVHPPDKNPYQQYFTLGEVFKAYGHYQDATGHMKECLKHKPGFELALLALKEMESNPDNNIHVYTLLIIVCLVLGVLLVIISSLDSTLEVDMLETKGQGRHFNRAMAMRSLKMGISPRAMRSKRYNGTYG